MKVLYVVKQDPDETMKQIMQEHGKSNEVTVFDVRTNKDYDALVNLIFSSDKVISV